MDLQSNSHLAANSSEYSSRRFFAISFSFRVLSSKSLASASVCNPPQAVCNCDEVAYVINTECWMLSRPKDSGGDTRYRVMPYCAGRRLHTRPKGVITCQALRSWIKIKATSKGRLNFWRCHPGIRHRRRYPRSTPGEQALARCKKRISNFDLSHLSFLFDLLFNCNARRGEHSSNSTAEITKHFERFFIYHACIV